MFSAAHFLFLSPVNLNNKNEQEICKRKFCRNSREGTTLENLIRSLMICTPQEILFDDQIEKNELFGTCVTYGGEEFW